MSTFTLTSPDGINPSGGTVPQHFGVRWLWLLQGATNRPHCNGAAQPERRQAALH